MTGSRHLTKIRIKLFSEREVRMNANQLNTGRGYWLAWFLASTLGYGIGAILGMSIAPRLFPLEVSAVANGMTLGVVTGLTGGYFQWVVLRERIARAGLWGLASAIGFGLAIGVVITTGTGRNFPVSGLLMAGIFGTVSGMLQWLILRRRVQRAGWWLMATLFGSLVGAIAVPIAGVIFDAGNWSLGVMIFGLVFGAGNGAITGAALVWLLRQSSLGDVEGLATAH